MFLGENQPHQYEAVALEDTHALNVRGPDVIDALLEYPEFGLAMVQDLARRHHKLTQRVLELDAELKRRESGAASQDAGATLEPSESAKPARSRGWWRIGRARPKPT